MEDNLIECVRELILTINTALDKIEHIDKELEAVEKRFINIEDWIDEHERKHTI